MVVVEEEEHITSSNWKGKHNLLSHVAGADHWSQVCSGAGFAFSLLGALVYLEFLEGGGAECVRQRLVKYSLGSLTVLAN